MPQVGCFYDLSDPLSLTIDLTKYTSNIVYEFSAADGTCLYVGYSSSGVQRAFDIPSWHGNRHRAKQEASTVKIYMCASREEARAIEAKYIKLKAPVYNEAPGDPCYCSKCKPHIARRSWTRLTQEEKNTICTQYLQTAITQRELAASNNVCLATVNKIVGGLNKDKRWR